MKKIVLAFILLFSICTVEAKTHYGPYSEFSDYGDKVISDDLTKVESKDFYQAYIETNELKYTEIDNGGNYILKDDSWVDYKPEFYSNTKTIYTYKNNRNRSIKVVGNGDNKIMSMNIMVDGKLLYFKQYAVGVSEAVLPIPSSNSLEEITLKVSFLEGNDNKGFKVILFDDSKEKIIREDDRINTTSYIIDSFNKEIDILGELRTTEDINEVKGEIISSKDYYLKQIKLFEEYEIIRKYFDLYFEDDTDIYKVDKTRIKKMYRYATRKKVDIKDNIIITSYDDDLLSFITGDNIKYTTNMNKLINGKYVVTYLTDIGNFKVDVIVDNPKNYKLLIDEQQKKLELMYESMMNANYLVNKKNQEIKDVLNSNNSEFILSEYENCKTKLRDEETKKIDLKETKKTSMSSVILVIVLTISMCISLLFKKNI